MELTDHFTDAGQAALPGGKADTLQVRDNRKHNH